MKKYFLFPVLLLVTGSGSFAQLGDVLKRSAAEGARQGAQNATVKTADKVVDRTLDKIFGGKKNKKPKEPGDTTGQNKEKTKTDTAPIAGKGKVENGSLKTYSRYDFIPGEKIMGYDDFSQDAIGDFPAKWTTNASGEIMTVENKEGKWLNLSKEGFYLAEFVTSMPENFTVEFDVLFIPPASRKGPNTANLSFQLINKPGKSAFEYAPDRSYFEFNPYMSNIGIGAYTKNGEKLLSNEFNVSGLDRNKAFTYHVAMWRQKSRMRVYLDETKVIDAPSLISPDINYNAIRFATSLNNDGSSWLISNFKYASGLPDTRNKLISEGNFSTTGILFDINSATIKASSYATLRDISATLKENGAVKVKIIGHTDSNGDNAANLELSKKRAQAVKAALTKEFDIDESRMETDGMGETKPVAPNTTTEGKARNRRVEFIKL
ncbi:MAG: OmpA family protein [Chitinophagaceae bacterium]